MTDDSVIEEAAKAIFKATGGHLNSEENGIDAARAALAVFEKAHAPTDDEREALVAEADALVESWDRRGSWDADSPVGMVMRLATALRRSEVPEPNTAHQCENCQTCGVHDGRHDKCCGCYDGVCCQESVPERQGEPSAGNLDHYTDPDDPFWQSRPEPVPQGEPSDALNYLDEINGQGRIEYDDYRNLHDLISGALEPAPELFPGTLDALEGLTIRKGQES